MAENINISFAPNKAASESQRIADLEQYVSTLTERTKFAFASIIEEYNDTADDKQTLNMIYQAVSESGSDVGQFTSEYFSEIFNDYENNIATHPYSHAEGFRTSAKGVQAHAEGCGTTAGNNSAHAEGQDTTASAYASHAEGEMCQATGWACHAEGGSTVAGNMYSHAEGHSSSATAPSSHAEGEYTQATAFASHAEGQKCIASGQYSHAGGNESEAIYYGSFVHGNGLKTTRRYEAVFGEYNDCDNPSLFSIGCGQSEEYRENALVLNDVGDLQIKGKYKASNGYDFSNAIASSTALGAIKIGENLSISEDGTLSANVGEYTLPVATADTLGGVKIGDNISVTADGTISVDLSTYLQSADIADWAKQPDKPVYTANEVGAAAEQHKHRTADITDFPAIPTKVSDLQNDSGYISEETDPTVPAWAKAESKPAYTAEEVGAAAQAHTHTKSQITDFPESLPANGGTADVAKKLTDWGTTDVTDADNAPLGLSKISNEGKNNPYTFWATLLTSGADDTDGYRQQWAFPWGWGEAPGKPKYRVKDNGTWFAWQSLPDGGNADTVDGKHASDFATAEDVSSAVSAVQIGGRNLLLGTGEISVIEGTNTADQCLAHHDLACGSIVNLEPGVYTCSADIIGTVEGGTAHMQFYGPPWETIPEMSGNVTVKTTKQKIGGTFTLSSPQTFSATGMRVRTDYVSGTITVSNMKLEKGNKPTDWTPAPEDDERRITSLEARVAALEAAAVSGGEV